MPVYDPQRRIELRNAGYNPDMMDEVEEVSPEPSPQPAPQTSKTTAKGALLRSAARALPSSGAGVLGGVGTGAALGTLGAGPIGTALGGIAGGLVSAIAARKLQDTAADKLIPGYTESMQQDVTEHPIASAVGDVAAGLPFFRPGSAASYKGALRALANPLRMGTADARDIGALANIGLGTAIPVGTQIATDPDVKLTQPMSIIEAIKNKPVEYAINALGGAILSEPTKLGQRLGLHPTIPRELPVSSDNAVANQKTGNSIEKTYYKNLSEKLKAETAVPKGTETAEAEAEAARLKAIRSELLPATINPVGEESIVPQKQIPTTDENFNPPPRRDAYSSGDNYYKNKYQTTDERQAPLKEGLARQGIPTTPTVETIEAYKKLGQERNVNLTADERVMTPSGEEKMGVSFPRKGLNEAQSKINPLKAGIDTPAHEVLHTFEDDLAVLGDKKAKAFVNRANRIFADSDAYKTWKAEREAKGLEAGVDEFKTTLGAEDVVRRIYSTDKKGDIRNWFDDVRAAARIKLNKGTPEDVARIMSSKLLYDAPFNQTFKGEGISNQGAKANVEEKRTIPVEEAPSENIPLEIKRKLPELPRENREGEEYFKPEKRLSEEEGDFRSSPKREVYSPGDNYYKNKYSSEAVKYADEKVVGDTSEPLPAKPWTHFASGETDRIRELNTPQAHLVADSAEKFGDRFIELRGELNNEFSEKARKIAGIKSAFKTILTDPKGYIAQDTPELNSTLQKLYQEDEGARVTYTPKEQEIKNLVESTIRSTVQKAKDMGVGIEDPSLRVPSVPKFSIIKEVLHNGDSPKARKLKQQFLDYHQNRLMAGGTDKGIAEKVAKNNLTKFLEGYTKDTVDTASKYGPLDKETELGLPPSWREDNLLNLMDRHLDRIARRFAYHEVFQRNPKVMEALSIDSLKGNQHVKAVMDNIKGNNLEKSPLINAALGVVKATNLGPLSGLRDLTATFFLGLQHMDSVVSRPQQFAKSIAYAVKNIREGVADGYKTGRIRQQMNDLEWNDSLGLLKRTRDVFTELQGRNFLEHVARGVAMGQGKIVTLDFHGDWTKGKLSKQGQTWFKKFAKDVDWKKSSLTEDEVRKIAARYVDSVQGKYDYSGLPQWSMEGQLSPIFALARWNIEKFNNYQKNVVEEAVRNMNFVPLLNSTIGIALGGTAVSAITELVSGRKDKLPEVSEIKAAKEMGKDITLPLAYKLAGLASLSGHTGIIGDIAKGAMDKMYGKNKPRWYDNMLVESAQGMANSFANIAGALSEENPSPDMVASLISKVLEDNLQTYRLVLNNLPKDLGGKKEDIERSNKMRDLRTFKTLEGDKVPDFTMSEYAEKYEDKDLKTFKRTEDVKEAAELLPDLVKEVLKEADSPEKLKAGLDRLKQNSYQSMPNPKTMPVSFARYVLYLKKSQGEEEANKRLMNYFKQNAVNQAKASMVPTVK